MSIFFQKSPKGHGLSSRRVSFWAVLASELLNSLFVNVHCCIGSSVAGRLLRFKTVFALFLSLFCLSVKATAADFVVSNNAVFVLFGDSYDEELYGSRYGCYLHSYLVLNYPQYNIYWRSASRSGGSLDDVLTNRVEKLGLAHWGYQLNNNQHVGLVMATDNGGDSSNVC